MSEPIKDILSTPNNNQPQTILPNATATLVLGILSLVFCIFYGILAIILGSIALYLAQVDKKLLDVNPHNYTQQSISNRRAGRSCALIGVILGGLFIIGIIIALFAAFAFK